MAYKIVDYFMGLFSNKKEVAQKGKFFRSLKGAMHTRLTEWLSPTLNRVNFDIIRDLYKVIDRSRELAKNNDVVRSWLNMLEVNIIGKTGFELQAQIKKDDSLLNDELNDEIEWLWWDFGKLSNGYLTVDGGMGHHEFDKLILRTLLVDGEVFIKIHNDARNKFGLSFEIIDAKSLCPEKNTPGNSVTNAQVMGVEIDRNFKPVKYWIRPGDSIYYQIGKPEAISADKIIHIYKKEFPCQVRGIPTLNCCLNDLKQLEDYQTAELCAAKVGAVLNLFYERNGMNSDGTFLDQEEDDDKGAFVQELGPGEASIVPMGYSVKSISSNHPNNGFGEFNKAVLKKIGAALGVSYNKLIKDFESVNFSSLRECALDERVGFESTQDFLINAWKEIEFKLFIEACAKQGLLKPTEAKQALMHHAFICQKRGYYDPSRDILATKTQLELGLKNPLQIIEENGVDPDELLKGWTQWKALCERYDLDFSDAQKEKAVNDPIEEKTDKEQMEEDGRKN